jgi:hypothetical protein
VALVGGRIEQFAAMTTNSARLYVLQEESPIADGAATATATETPTATATPTRDEECPRPEGVIDPPPLSAIFDLHTNVFGVVIAAIFGLAPGLLVQRLQSQVKRYQSDLQSTNTSGTSA